MVSAAVLKEEPVVSYNHKVSANVVMLLPIWETLCVLQRIRKFFSGCDLFFIYLCSFFYKWLHITERSKVWGYQPRAISSMQSPQTLHGAVTIQSIILFSFRRYESIHISKELILLYCALVTLSMKLRACFLQDTASIHATWLLYTLFCDLTILHRRNSLPV